MIDTNALAPSTRGGGRWSNFSISGNEMSTCGTPVSRRARISAGSRCSVCGPNTTSTYGARRTIARAFLRRDAAADADDEVGALGLQRAHAAEVVEHALLRLLAHRAGVEQDDVGVFGPVGGARPSDAPSTSAILSESYSFIWQPNVRM